MPKKVNQSGEQNFLIGLSKQTSGSDGFMPSGHHHHKKFWCTVLGVIVVIVLFIFGVNIYGNHQSKSSQPTHHTRITKVTTKKSAHHHAKKTKQDKAKAIRERARQRAKRAKRLIRERIAAERKAARRDRSTTTSHVAPQRQTNQTYRTMKANKNNNAKASSAKNNG